MEPESNQQSITSGTRFICLPHSGTGDGHRVDIGPVQLNIRPDSYRDISLQLRDASHRMAMAAARTPRR